MSQPIRVARVFVTKMEFGFETRWYAWLDGYLPFWCVLPLMSVDNIPKRENIEEWVIRQFIWWKRNKMRYPALEPGWRMTETLKPESYFELPQAA